MGADQTHSWADSRRGQGDEEPLPPSPPTALCSARSRLRALPSAQHNSRMEEELAWETQGCESGRGRDGVGTEAGWEDPEFTEGGPPHRLALLLRHLHLGFSMAPRGTSNRHSGRTCVQNVARWE